MHSKIERHVKNRLKSIETGNGLDWATAEVCLGSLVLVLFLC
jgi:probable 2-oxoglutarate dehydrogenase E1 component DHKTD1